MTWLALVLAIGATARLTLLLTADTFPPAAKLRAAVLRWATRRQPKTRSGYLVGDPAEHPAYVLVTCPWCCSPWIGAGVLTAAWFWPTAWWFVIPAGALTASLAAGLAGQVRD